MSGESLTFSDLQAMAEDGSIDTVIVGFTDHYGRLMGKRFDADFFCDSIDEGTHACRYLFTVDMEMEPLEGFEFADWSGGYGDMHLVPDLDTLRIAAWADRTAIVLCDVVEGEDGIVSVSPRTILQRQVDALGRANVGSAAASELEFFIFRDSYQTAHAKDYRDVQAAGWYVEDYHLLQSERTEDFVGPARRALKASGVPVESSKGEAATGQHEINLRYAPAMEMADRHVVMKQCLKALADSKEMSVTFMAKPFPDTPGSSCHLHISLWHDGRNAFSDGIDGYRTDIFRWFLGGWMAHTHHLMPFYAPTVNSYKRYQDASWAPTRIAWSTDNRTAGFRVVGSGNSLRIECRIPGADANPYLAFAAALASGLDGIANKTEPPPPADGDQYAAFHEQRVPSTLAEANEAFRSSAESVRLLGDEVVAHYGRFFQMEYDAYNRAVTDWERRRYFERI